jgi:Sulfotransferase family
MKQAHLPKSMADISAFVQGADAALVTEVLADMPPAFFVVGAPRCGTTALSRALASHRHIRFSKPKETHFFLEDCSHMTTEAVRRLYLECFQPNLARDSQAIGDGSVSYLYSPRRSSRHWRSTGGQSSSPR